MAARHLFGTTVTFGTSGFAAQITNVTPPTGTRPALETTHMTTAAGAEHTNASWRTYIPSDLGNWDPMRVTMHYDPDLTPPIDEPAETITIQYPPATGQSTGATMVFSGFMTSISAEVVMDNVATGDYELTVSGDVNLTQGS